MSPSPFMTCSYPAWAAVKRKKVVKFQVKHGALTSEGPMLSKSLPFLIIRASACQLKVTWASFEREKQRYLWHLSLKRFCCLNLQYLNWKCIILFFLLFVFSSRLWDRFSLRGHPPRPVHLSRSRPPSSQETQIPDPRRVVDRWNSPLPSEWLGAGVPHGAAGDLRRPDCTWLYHPGPGKERHQEPEGLPEAWPLLLPGVAEVEG